MVIVDESQVGLCMISAHAQKDSNGKLQVVTVESYKMLQVAGSLQDQKIRSCCYFFLVMMCFSEQCCHSIFPGDCGRQSERWERNSNVTLKKGMPTESNIATQKSTNCSWFNHWWLNRCCWWWYSSIYFRCVLGLLCSAPVLMNPQHVCQGTNFGDSDSEMYNRTDVVQQQQTRIIQLPGKVDSGFEAFSKPCGHTHKLCHWPNKLWGVNFAKK